MFCGFDSKIYQRFAWNWLLLLLLMWLGRPAAFAQSVSLTWNPSMDTNAVGYKIYYGEASGVYPYTTYVANATTTNATLYGLTGGVTYYFSATTVSASGSESPYSNETTFMTAASTNGTSATNSTPVTQPPALNPIGNITLSQNAGAQTVTLAGIGAGTSGNATVNVYAISSDNGTVITAPAVSYTNPNSTGTLTFSPVASGIATVTVSVDNGGASNNVTSQVFTVTVNPVNSNNGTPTVNPIGDVTIYQNSGMQTIPLNGITTGVTGSYQFVSIWAYTSDAAIIPAPNVNYTSPNGTGSLTFTPVAGALGKATITVTANNGNANFSLTFNVTVVLTPTNTPPTLSAITNRVIYNTAGAQTVNLAGIGAGTSGNASVTAYAVASDNGAIISTPMVNYASSSSTGTLTFTPVAGATGTATVTVTVNNGGAANNSVSQTFTVTVQALPPTLNPVQNLTIYQNAGVQVISLTGISPGTTGNASATVSAVSSDNGNVISTPAVNYTSPNTACALSFSPVGTGTATVTVTVANISSAIIAVTQTFTITVLPVPQTLAPTLNAITNLTVYENAGQQTVNLTGISAGTSGNSTVNVYALASDNGTVISAPVVNYTNSSSTGTLTFAPVAGVTGTATVTITVDNGGVTNNPLSQVFTVNVIAAPPTLDPVSNVTIPVAAGLQTINLTGIAAGTSGNPTVNVYSVSSDNGAVITAPAVNYTAPNTTGTLSFSPVAAGTATVTVTVDNGGTGNNLISQVFTVTVMPPAPAIPLPTLNPISNLAVVEGVTAASVTLTGISSGLSNTVVSASAVRGQLTSNASQIRVTATSSNSRVVAAPSIRYSSPASSGLMTLRLGGVAGTSVITVTVINSSKTNNTCTQTFTVTVAPPTAPTLDPTGNVTVTGNSGQQTIVLTGITPGSIAAGQSLRISASSSNMRLLSNLKVQYSSPATTALLTFTPNSKLTGTTTLKVTASNGGRINGSVVRQFTVTVTAPSTNSVASAAVAAVALPLAKPIQVVPNAPALLTTLPEPAGQIGFQVTGTPGGTYTVQTSSDLQNWTSVQTNSAPFVFVDNSSGLPRQFYRAVSQ